MYFILKRIGATTKANEKNHKHATTIRAYFKARCGSGLRPDTIPRYRYTAIMVIEPMDTPWKTSLMGYKNLQPNEPNGQLTFSVLIKPNGKLRSKTPKSAIARFKMNTYAIDWSSFSLTTTIQTRIFPTTPIKKMIPSNTKRQTKTANGSFKNGLKFAVDVAGVAFV